MKDDKIIIPDFLLAEMYKTNLHELDDSFYKLVNTEEISNNEHLIIENIKVLGKNERNILVLVNEKKYPFLPDDDLKFLSNILLACKLNLSDIGIINFAHFAVNFTICKEHFEAQKILLFGLTSAAIKLPFTVPDFQVQPYNECVILQSPPLSTLNHETQESKILKSQLWISLKKIFDV